MTAKVIQMRDFKRKEEREQERLVKLAKEVMGLVADTAPSELHYHGAYIAPDKDPA